VACASGRQALGRPDRARAILRRLQAQERFVATLGGARLIAERDLLITREAGEFSRRACAPLSLKAGQPAVWDGRFELLADKDGLAVQPLRGLAAGLESLEKAALCAVPAPARGALPAVTGPTGGPTCPILATASAKTVPVRLTGLVGARFAAACGLLAGEGETCAIVNMANWDGSSYVGSEC
jgi:tRNA(Ile)-lysidine synthase